MTRWIALLALGLVAGIVQSSSAAEKKVPPALDFKMDSLTLIELILRLEEEFGVDISQDDGRELRDVREAVQYIESKLA